MIETEVGVFAILLGVVGIYLWLMEQKFAEWLFEYVPPILLIFLTCMALGNAGILPEDSEAYSWIKRHLMPFAIFLFMLSVNIPAIFKIGRLATIMIFVGMASVTLGFFLSAVIFSPWIEPEAWAPLIASYAGSVGGSQNLVAMAETFDASPSILGALIAVDSIVGYTFLALLVSLATHKARFNAWLHAKEKTIAIVHELSVDSEQKHLPVSSGGVAMIIFMGVTASVICRSMGEYMSSLVASDVLTPSIWTLILVVTSGLLLSLSPIKTFNAHGTVQIGQIALYLIMAVFGAGALIEHVWQYKIFLIYSPVLLMISLVSVLIVGRILRVPMILVVTGLYANLGGTVSNPIVASAYDKGFVSIALLMAIVTQIIGMYTPLFLAPLMRWILA